MNDGEKTREQLIAELEELRRRIYEFEQAAASCHKTEEELRQSEDRYIKLVGAVTDYIYTVQVDNGIPVKTTHGPGCVSVTGYASEEYEADPFLWLRMIYEEDRAYVISQSNRVLSGETAQPLEHRIIHKDGNLRWVKNTPVPRHDANGRLIAYDGLISDITERKQAEEALLKNEKKFRDITSSLGEGIYVSDENGFITFMNPEAERLLGWTEKELVSRNMHDVIHGQRADESPLILDDCKIHNVVKTGKRFFSDSEVFRHKDGSLFPVSVMSSPIIVSGSIIACVTAFQDITERKQTEEEKKRLINELREALAKVRTLSGMLPICASCKKIRDDKGYWNQIEVYITEHSEADFSHSICPECAKKLYPEYFDKVWGTESENT